MDSKEYLSRIHSEILTVMDEVVRVCKKNNLRYYLIGGTLLGAVRHGGFIPWDDDLDIAMPRDDFETFIKIAPQELRYPFELQWTTTNKEYWLQFAKVCNTNTLFDERSYHKCNRSFGVFVDIFALDRTVGFSEELVCRKNKIVRLMTMMRTRLGITENPRKIDRILNVVAAPLSIRFMHNVMTRLMKKTNQGCGAYYTNFGSQYHVKKQTMPVEYFGNGSPIAFEDRVYSAPDNKEAVLTSIFGESYMMLPPVEKRRTHYPVKVVFSNGDSVSFDSSETRVKVED